ncbi:MAG TPA: peroxiredoxin [Burkholderiales bacterium]|jgi:thioredoxin-dependent peroxiredoxin|nr:peroxiredoxin [Burkholderiales bacterium]
MSLHPGDPAPKFRALSTQGHEISLDDFRGRKLVLYFYPRDDTPGCTAQACSLRDYNAEIEARGASILGVSSQDRLSHERFSEKYALNFPLLADTDRSVARAYGAIGGGVVGAVRALLGVAQRVTYIIDERGRIAHIINRPDCSNHAAEVLRVL